MNKVQAKTEIPTTSVDGSPVINTNNPTGCIDNIVATLDSITVTGWAFDLDQYDASCKFEVYIDDQFLGEATAMDPRDDVNECYQIVGLHGINSTFKTTLVGNHEIRVFAVDINDGSKHLIGRKAINLLGSPTNLYLPQGWIDQVIAESDGYLSVGGWAFDKDNLLANLKCNIYAGTTYIGSLTADQLRDDVNDVFGIKGQHGYSGRFKTNLRGLQTISIYMEDPITHKESIIGSRNVQFEEAVHAINAPIGCVDHLFSNVPGEFYTDGWIFDYDARGQAVQIRMYCNGIYAGTLTASDMREDVNGLYGLSNGHGFSGTIKTNQTGLVTVEYRAVDIGTNQEVTIKKQQVEIKKQETGKVESYIDDIQATAPGEVYVGGWSLFTGNYQYAMKVEAYIGATKIGVLTANQVRDDVNLVMGSKGNHGFSGRFNTTLYGLQKVDLYAINPTTNQKEYIGSRTIDIPKKVASNHAPVGCFDVAVDQGDGKAYFSGWGYDLDDLSASLEARVYANGTYVGSLYANQARGDVNLAMGITGNPGFSGELKIPYSGLVTFTIKIVDPATKEERLIGSKNATMSQKVETPNVIMNVANRDPVYHVDVLEMVNNQIHAGGWVYDLDQLGANVKVNIYVGNQLAKTITAGNSRPDVNRVNSVTGNHGFDVVFDSPLAGNQEVRVVAVDVNTGKEITMKKATLNIQKAVSQTSNHSAAGCTDSTAALTGKSVAVGGWAFDLDSPNSKTRIRIAVDGITQGIYETNTSRPDINNAYGLTNKHGFFFTFDVPTYGNHLIDVFVIDDQTNQETKISSQTVTNTEAVPPLVKVALSQLSERTGVIGGSKYINWYNGNPYAEWCAMFTSWCAEQCGMLNTQVPRFSYCGNAVDWYKARGRFSKNITPKAGDLVFFDYEHDGFIDHVAIIEAVRGNFIYTIEGNYAENGQGSPLTNPVKRGSHVISESGICGFASV